MKAVLRTVLFLFVTYASQAQIKPNCDVDCGPAPTPTPTDSGGTTTTPNSFTSLSGQSDQRGFGNVRSAVAQTGGAVTVQGSQSYTYTVPIFSVPGRAGSNLNLNLYYNSHVWIQGSAGMMMGIDRDTPSPGFQLNFGFLEWNPAPGTPNGVLSTADGTKHTLSILISDLVQDPNTGLTSCINQVCQYASDDSSYYFVSRPLGTKSGLPCTGPTNCPAPDVTVTDKNGTTSLYESFAVVTNDGPDEFVMRPYKITDRNGNFITISYVDVNSINVSSVTDTLGRVTNFVYNADGTLQCVTDGGPTCSTSTGPLGKIPLGPGREYTFNWNTSQPINFNFAGQTTALVGATLYNVASGFTLPMLSSVCRPDTTCVKFNYGDWGIVNDIQEFGSDGTTVRYELSYDFPLASAGQLTANPTYTNETETTNGKTVTWNTSISIDTTTGLLASSTITDPHGLSTTTFFSHNGPPDWHDGLPTEIDMDSLRIDPCLLGPCPTLLKRNLTWTSDPSPSYPPDSTAAAVNRANPHPSTIVTTLEDGSQKQVSYSYDVPSGNVTDLQETDFGATAPGPLLRETVTSYQTVGFHILGMPKDVQVKDGVGKVVSHSVMAYDETATQSVPTSVTGHDDVAYPAGNTFPRGNLTSVIAYPNAASTSGGISTTYAYDMLGNRVGQIQGGIKTALNFSSITDYAYPDSVVQDPQGATPLATSFTYNSRGQVLTQTDWNSQVTQFGYDGAGRPSTVKTPDNVTVTTQYDDASANPAIQTFNSVNPASVAVHTTDFLGRAVSDQIMTGTTAVSTTTYDDDQKGTVKVSNPFGPGETPIYQTSTYDLFGRTTSMLPPAITAGQAQQPYSIQLHGNTKVITDPANHQRREIVNGLGQMVEVDLPGTTGGAAATGSGNVSGTELSVPSTSASNGATAGTASVTIGGTGDRSTTVITQVATPTKITVTIGGQDGTNTTTSTLCTGGPPSRLPLTCRTTTQNNLDSGNMQFSVNAGGTVITSQQVPYSSGSTTATLAQALAGALPANSFVTVSYGGASSFTVTTTATGSATSTTSVSMSIVSSCVDSSSDTSTVSCMQGWTASQSVVAGVDQTTAPNSDTGQVTVSITANNTTYTKQSNYTGASTPASIALDLYNQFNGDTGFSQLVRATQPGTGGIATNAIGFTTIATGAATNYGLSVSSVTTDSNFTAGSTSFPISDSGSTFTPGQNGTLYDNGTVTLSVSGFSAGTPPSKQVTYGQGSNAPGIAAQLASLVHNDPLFPVDATVPPGSSAISFTARFPGVSGNSYVVTINGVSSLAASFPTPSFASPATQAALGNGADPTYSLDSGVAVATHYTYDPRGMALQITNGPQTQSYAYDGLGRLTSMATPETNGPVQYTYMDFGAIHERIDPRTLPGTSTPVKATYGYDTLGRVKTTTYNDSVTPAVNYTYDPPASAHNTGGRVSSISNAVETKAYQYDVMGRTLQCLETIGTNSYTVGYSYAPDGALSSLTYPSQKVVNFSYDPLDRLTQVMLGSTQKIFSISPSDYTAAGMPVKLSYGNNIVGQFGYNAQLQLSSIQYGAAAPAAPLLSLNYLYGDGLDNGQIQGITDNVVAERSTSYKYDPLGQLVMAQTTDLAKPNTWKLAFNYDQYGNRLNEIPQAGAGAMPGNSVTVSTSSNHISSSGVTYDNAGNTVADGVNYYTFDAENRLVATSPVVGLGGPAANFSYGPDGARVNNNGTYVIYAGGQPIAEYANGAASGSPTAEYINVNGNQVASIVGGALSFNFADHLSTRVSADLNGVPNRTYGHFPFGETWYQTGTSNKWDFTSYERDLNSSGLDYANARFYSSRLGRFISLDQVLGSNRFAYVGNDPVNLVDPTGMDAACTNDPFTHSPMPLCGPDQAGSAVGSNCGANFGNDGFSINFTSNCSSFSINLGNFGGVPFGDLGQTIHNTLATIINIDTCPEGEFECPEGGRPLFGTPSCGPFCVMDATVSAGPANSKQTYCSTQARYAAENDLSYGFANAVYDRFHMLDHRFGPSPDMTDAAISYGRSKTYEGIIEARKAKELAIARQGHRATRYIKTGAEILGALAKVVDLGFAANAYDERYAACMNYMNGTE
jgi:RHS repeat-associated protein